MKPLVIAFNTFREAMRNKILYTLIFFAILVTGLSILLSTAVLGTYTHVIIDIGLGAIEVFCTLIAIFVGITLVHKEMELRTIYVIISRPVPRWQVILGKYLGLLLTLCLEMLIMGGVLFGIVALFGEAERIPDLALAIALIGVKVMLITSIAVLFSSFSTPILSGMLTLAFYVIAATSRFLEVFLAKDALLFSHDSTNFQIQLIRVMRFILPDFHYLDLKSAVVYKEAVDPALLAYGTCYGLLYSAIILFLAMLIFERRDVK